MTIPPDLFEKYARGECTDAEMAQLSRWLQDGHTDGVPVADGDARSIWRKIESRRRRARVRRLLPWAAAAALLTAAVTIYWQFRPQQPGMLVASAPAGKTVRTLLPDSSVVYLEGPATLRYPGQFAQGGREVSLTGNASFEVRGSERSPFTVVSGNVRTVALGTSFHVSAPAGADRVDVSLRHGKVRVSHARDTVYLQPGESLTYAAGRHTVQPSLAGEYRSSVLLFRRAGMEEVTAKLGRYYNLRVVADTALAGRNWEVTGEFQGESAEFVARHISFIMDLRYRFSNDTLYLMPAAPQP
ncbi:FecR family protein [Chitinophaga lutea]